MPSKPFLALPGRAGAGLRWGRIALCFAAAGMGLLALGCGAWALDHERDEAQAIHGLRNGGYVIYLRHADRYKGPKETLNQYSSPAEFADCSDQRNLTPKGRAQATALGSYFRELDIPVGRVIANAQCRTRDTAVLAFGRTEVEPRVYDHNFVSKIMSQPQAPGDNTVVVGNDAQFIALTGIQLGRAEAAVVKPNGRGGFVVLAELDLEDWREAAEPGWW